MGGRPTMPPISQYDQSMIETLFDIGPVQPIGMGGEIAISESEIGWYRLNRRAKLTNVECALLRDMSRTYASALSAAREKDCPRPWQPVTIDREAVAKGMREWAQRMKAMKAG